MTPSLPQSLGRYEILEEIGRGAMGVVYLARDPRLDRRVALKALKLGGSDDEELLEERRMRFLREARAAAALEHPGIVTVHDVDEDSDTGALFITMEMVEGVDLKQRLRRDGPLPPSRAALVIADVAEALAFAHQRGVVHRDVKPANLLLSVDGRVRITDFGIARLEESDLTFEGQSLGTPNYMSPEQADGHPVDHRSDIFSLGVVLFELVAGRKPFLGENVSSTCYKIVHDPPPLLADLLGQELAPLDHLLSRFLSKSPADRPQSASEMAAQLRLVASQLPGQGSGMPADDPGDHDSGLPTRPMPEAGGGEDPDPLAAAATPAEAVAADRDESSSPPFGWRRALPSWAKWLAAAALLAAAFSVLPMLEELANQRDFPDQVVNDDGARLRHERLEEAEALLAAGDPEAARETVMSILEELPEHAGALALLARLDAPERSRPASGPAEIRLRFVSEQVGSGFLTVYVDLKQVLREEIDWNEKTGVFRRREIGGEMERSLRVEPGARKLRVQFVSPSRKTSARQDRDLQLLPGQQVVVIARLGRDGDELGLELR